MSAPVAPAPAAPTSSGGLARWLLAQVRPVLAPLWGSTLARILDQLAGCVLYAVGAWTLARLAFNPTGVSLGRIIALMVALCLVKGILHYLEQFLGHFVAFKALELLRRNVFECLIPASPAALAAHRSGDLLARLTTDIDRIEVFFAHTIAPAIGAIVVPSIVCVGIGVVAGPAAGGAAAAIVAVTLILFVIVGRQVARHSSLAALGAKGEVAQQLTDSLQGVGEVVGYGLEDARLASLRAGQERVGADDARLAWVFALRRGTGAVGLLAVVTIPAWLAADAGAPVWVVAALAPAAWRAWDAIRGVEDFSTALATSFAAAARVRALVEAPPAVTDGPGTLALTAAPDLTWDNVTFTYPATPGRDQAPPVLAGVTATARAGEWTALVGATGSGKSTLLALALRYWDPEAGSVRLAGRDIREVSVASLRNHMAVVDQRPHLFTGTIASNLRLSAPDATEEQMWEALEAACLADEVRAWGGLETRVGERAHTMSGGQAQRLALARAFMRPADLVILDEFTSHLDPDLAARVRVSVRRVFPHATVLEVTHTPPAEALENPASGIDQLLVVDSGAVTSVSGT